MAQRAWPLGSDLAGVGTAMITVRAVPAPLPAQITVSQISSTTASRDFADPLPPLLNQAIRQVPLRLSISVPPQLLR